MKLNAACAVLVLLTGVITTDAQSDYQDRSLDLLRLLSTNLWSHEPRSHWDQTPRIHMDLNPQLLTDDDKEAWSDDVNDGLSIRSSKRSAVATALNTGRRRRQPTPALGKEVTLTPYFGAGVLSDMSSFFDSLRDNLEILNSLSPAQKSTMYKEPPTVVHAASSGGGGSGGGTGIRKLHALRPLRPTGNIRSYNRRSSMEADGVYPGANHHDPGLLWTGLGR